MDNLDRLKSVILREARERAAAMIQEAKSKAVGIVEEARARGARSIEEAAERAEAASAVNERRADITRSLDQRNAVLRAKGELVDKLISELPGAVHKIAEQRYLELLRHMILEAAPSGQVDVVVAQNDKARVTAAFLDGAAAELGKRGSSVSFRLAGHSPSIEGGFMLRTPTVEVDCSLEALVALSEDELAPLVADALFGGR